MSPTRWLDVVWTDVVGRAQVVRVARDAVERGEPIAVPRSRVAAGFSARPEDSPLEMLELSLDWTTERVVPWDQEVGVCIAELHDPGKGPSPLCARSLLRGVARGAEAEELAVEAAVELEFFVVDSTTRRPVYSWIDNYNLSRVEAEPVITDVRRQLRAMGVGVEASNPEYSGAQFEINLRHADLLAAADQAVMARLYTGALARRNGFDATFMPKPWSDQSGSGVHVHQSLWRRSENVFHDADLGLSSVGRAYLAGLLASMADFALLGSPTPNGFHRRTDGSFAPTMVAWAIDNRTTAARAVLDGPEGTRIEHRDGSGNCNFYLLIAAQVLAGLGGVKRGAELPAPVVGNAYGRDLPRLPATFPEAFEQLRVSELARELLPEPLLAAYLEALLPEVEAVTTLTADWERARYADVPLA